MAMDLNKIREKLKNRTPLGVTRDGQLQEQDPRNDGTREERNIPTTLTPKRFFTRGDRK